MGNGIGSGVEIIKPAIAAVHLGLSPGNRKFKEKNVARMVRDIASGRWALNGESIVFDENGLLMDGHNRMMAIVKAGISVSAIVVRGVKRETFKTIDGSSSPRSLADVLGILGEKNAKALGSTLYQFLIIRGGKGYGSNMTYSNDEALDVLADHPGIRDSVSFCLSCRKHMPLQVAAAYHYVFSEIDRELADAFFSYVAHKDVVVSQPIDMFRERMLANYASKSRYSRQYISALTIKAWNAAYTGHTVSLLRWRTSGSAAENFPTIAGLA